MLNVNKLLAAANKDLSLINKEIALQKKLIKVQAVCNIQQQLLEKTLICIGDAVISTDIKNNIVF